MPGDFGTKKKKTQKTLSLRIKWDKHIVGIYCMVVSEAKKKKTKTHDRSISACFGCGNKIQDIEYHFQA